MALTPKTGTSSAVSLATVGSVPPSLTAKSWTGASLPAAGGPTEAGTIHSEGSPSGPLGPHRKIWSTRPSDRRMSRASECTRAHVGGRWACLGEAPAAWRGGPAPTAQARAGSVPLSLTPRAVALSATAQLPRMLALCRADGSRGGARARTRGDQTLGCWADGSVGGAAALKGGRGWCCCRSRRQARAQLAVARGRWEWRVREQPESLSCCVATAAVCLGAGTRTVSLCARRSVSRLNVAA